MERQRVEKIYETIKNALELAPGLTVIKIPPFYERLDEQEDGKQVFLSQLLECQKITEIKPLYSEEDQIMTFFTFAASPHTPSTISLGEKKYPAHLIGWAIKITPGNYQKLTHNTQESTGQIDFQFIELKNESETNISSINSLMHQLNIKGLNFLKTHLPHDNTEDLQDTKVYIHTGSSDSEDLNKGLGPTNQSNMFLHWHLTYGEKITGQNLQENNARLTTAFTNKEIPTEQDLYLTTKLIDPIGNLLTLIYQSEADKIIKGLNQEYQIHISRRKLKKTIGSVIVSNSIEIDISDPEIALKLINSLRQRVEEIRNQAKQMHEISYLARFLFHLDKPEEQVGFKKLFNGGYFEKAANLLGIDWNNLSQSMDNILNDRNSFDIDRSQEESSKKAKIDRFIEPEDLETSQMEFEKVMRIIYTLKLNPQLAQYYVSKFSDILFKPGNIRQPNPGQKPQRNVSKALIKQIKQRNKRQKDIQDFLSRYEVDNSRSAKENWIQENQGNKDNPVKLIYDFYSNFFTFGGAQGMVTTMKYDQDKLSKLIISFTEMGKGGAESRGDSLVRPGNASLNKTN